MPTPRQSPCLPAMPRRDDGRPPRRWLPPGATLALTASDQVTVAQVGARYAACVILAPAARPTGQTDDLDERLVHAARFRSYAAALRLVARISRSRALNVTHWLWEPREHGRFVAPPVATPYDVER